MNPLHMNNRSHYHLLTLTLIFCCLFGAIIAQTFQYSRGWTNGKKRSSPESFLVQGLNDGQEVFGICQMQRLKAIWKTRRLGREYLPCTEVADQAESIVSNRFEKNSDCYRHCILDSISHQRN